MRATVRLLGIPSLVALAGLLLAGCGQMTRPLHITYYYLPDAPESSEMRPAVEGLEKEFPGKVEAHGVDATSSEAQRMFRTLGFRTHGLVIHGRRGELLWKQADQDVNLDATRQAVRDLLAGHPPAST